MVVKRFHLGDVLSVTAQLIISPGGIDGLYSILSFMTGDDIFLTNQLPRVTKECKPYLIEQFPQLVTPRMDLAVANLRGVLNVSVADRKDLRNLIKYWLSVLTSGGYGIEIEETLPVAPVPRFAHQFKNPIAEDVDTMSGADEIIVVKITT